MLLLFSELIYEKQYRCYTYGWKEKHIPEKIRAGKGGEGGNTAEKVDDTLPQGVAPLFFIAPD